MLQEDEERQTCQMAFDSQQPLPLHPNTTKYALDMLRSCLLLLFSLFHFSHAVDLYLHPFNPSLSQERASFALARHLDLDLFEPLPLRGSSSVYREDEVIFGKGQSSALLIALDSSDAAGQISPLSFGPIY